jgi:hypothetical protein
MMRAGPSLAVLTHRLAATPAEFLGAPAVAAVVNDVLRMHGRRAGARALLAFQAGAGKVESNRLQLVAVCAWLLADASFIGMQVGHDDLLRALVEAPAQLAATSAAAKFIADSERREELARVVLTHLGVLPAGETPAQAVDRLSAISGAQRRTLLDASRAAEKRAREIRAALAAKAAQESADKWTRE